MGTDGAGRWRGWARAAVGGALGVALALAAGAPPGWADGGGGSGGGTPAPAGDPAYQDAVRAIERGQYAQAATLLEGVVRREPANADAYNRLGYAVRRGGDARRALPYYERALAIDPRHRGAHEYIGEAYLVLGDLPRAREHLTRLDKLCLFSCAEYRDLKKAIEAYERSGGQVRPAAGPGG